MRETMYSQNFQILECTLRDGSYVIDFQFTGKDTAIIAAGLENAGFNLIEIGHGWGLNASNAGKGAAAATDEEYMEAVASTLKRARWGMFFIPGIGRHEDLELAARYGMNFIRIGTNATEVDQSKKYIEKAKRLGLFVSANLMKSYVLPPRELAVKAKLSERFGSDIICLVDSAGSMLPDDIRAYITAMKDFLNIPIGFHCHDNLALGMANVLTAIDCGVEQVDSTLQGMGRGGGNPATEVLVTVLMKKGIDLGIDLHRLMNLSEHLIKPMLKGKGWDPIHITSGYAGFHSSYMQTILKYADLYHLDPRDLIIAVCKVDQIYASEEMVRDVAQTLQREQIGRAGLHIVSLPRLAFPDKEREKDLGETLMTGVRKLAGEVRTTAKKRGRHSVLNIVAAPQPVGKATISRFVQEEFDYVIGSVEVDNRGQMKEIVEAVDGIIDILLIDSELKPYLDQPLTYEAHSTKTKSRILGYKDNDVWVHSVSRQIEAMLHGVRDRHITVCGTDNLAMKLVLSLIEQGAWVTLTGESSGQLESSAQALMQISLNQHKLSVEIDPIQASREAEALVAFDRQRVMITRFMLEVLPPDAIVFDAGIGSVSMDAIANGTERRIRIVRPDMRASLAAELASALGTSRIVNELSGIGEINGVPVVAGGRVAPYGTIVLDSITNPSKVIGVADGKGKVIYGRKPEFQEKIEKVEEEILRKQVLAE